jgi:hypothetical protein
MHTKYDQIHRLPSRSHQTTSGLSEPHIARPGIEWNKETIRDSKRKGELSLYIYRVYIYIYLYTLAQTGSSPNKVGRAEWRHTGPRVKVAPPLAHWSRTCIHIRQSPKQGEIVIITLFRLPTSHGQYRDDTIFLPHPSNCYQAWCVWRQPYPDGMYYQRKVFTMVTIQATRAQRYRSPINNVKFSMHDCIISLRAVRTCERRRGTWHRSGRHTPAATRDSWPPRPPVHSTQGKRNNQISL